MGKFSPYQTAVLELMEDRLILLNPSTSVATYDLETLEQIENLSDGLR